MRASSIVLWSCLSAAVSASGCESGTDRLLSLNPPERWAQALSSANFAPVDSMFAEPGLRLLEACAADQPCTPAQQQGRAVVALGVVDPADAAHFQPKCSGILVRRGTGQAQRFWILSARHCLHIDPSPRHALFDLWTPYAPGRASVVALGARFEFADLGGQLHDAAVAAVDQPDPGISSRAVPLDETPAVELHESLYMIGFGAAPELKLSAAVPGEANAHLVYRCNQARFLSTVDYAATFSGAPLFNSAGELVGIHSGRGKNACQEMPEICGRDRSFNWNISLPLQLFECLIESAEGIAEAERRCPAELQSSGQERFR